MTTVNWERLPGETVEEFVEALILTTVNPRAVRITPSRGDKGVDILAPVGDKFDVYQVKRYTRPFSKSSSEEKSIVESWTRFKQEFLPAYPIRRWNLVMPWNPTPERYSWMMDELTADASIERDWLGRGSLDVWSANNPALQAYFFGDGRDRVLDLMASALNGAKDVPAVTGEPLLDAVVAREMTLTQQLDEVDPFYRYEVAVRKGHLTESVVDQFATIDKNAALVTFREIEGGFYQQLSIYPKCQDSGRLRPISTTFSIDGEADDEALRAAHDMLAYGVEPDRPIPVNIINSEGPPGTDAGAGPALLYVMNMNQPTHPDLEVRLGESRLAFTNVLVTRGFEGVQVTGDVQGGVFKIGITFHDGGQTREIEVETTPLAGKLPHTVVPALEFIRDWTSGSVASLALPHGKELLSFGTLPNAELFTQDAKDWLKVAQHLIQLQSVCSTQLLMPTSLTNWEADAIADAVRLLAGEILESDWSGFEFELRNPDPLNSSDDPNPLFQFLSFIPFWVQYDDVRHDLDGVVAHWGVAQLADHTIAEKAAPGDDIAVIPGPGHKLFRQYGKSGPPI